MSDIYETTSLDPQLDPQSSMFPMLSMVLMLLPCLILLPVSMERVVDKGGVGDSFLSFISGKSGIAILVGSTLVFGTVHCPHPMFLVIFYTLLGGQLVRDARQDGQQISNSTSKNKDPPLNQARLVQRMKEAQESRESSLRCAEGDQLKVIDFADMAEAAFNLSDAAWARSLKAYLGTTGLVEQVDDNSVLLRHADGQAIWWAYGAVKMAKRNCHHRLPRSIESNLTSSPGDEVRTLEDARAVEAAFQTSDARWNLSLRGYLGQCGRVEAAEEQSVLLVHADGQRIWWPWHAVVLEKRAPKPIRSCALGDLLRTTSSAAAARSAFALSDASFAASLAHYLGSSGHAREIHARSVLVQHADGQAIWWPYAALFLQVPPQPPLPSGHTSSSTPSSSAAPPPPAPQKTLTQTPERSSGGGAWFGVRGYVAAAIASALAFVSCHLPHPLFLALYYGVLATALLLSDEAAAWFVKRSAAQDSSLQPSLSLRQETGYMGLLLLWAAALVLMASAAAAYLAHSISAALFLAAYFATFSLALSLSQPVQVLQAAAVGGAAAAALAWALAVAAVGVVAIATRVAGADACARALGSLFGEQLYATVVTAAATCSITPLLVLLLVGGGGWLMFACSRPHIQLIYNASGPMGEIVARCPILLHGFRAPPQLASGRFMALYSALRGAPAVIYRRELMRMKDGREVSLDWLSRTHRRERGGKSPGSGPILILLHSLSSGSEERCVRDLAEAACVDCRMRSCVLLLECRGARRPMPSSSSASSCTDYCSCFSCTDQLAQVVAVLASRHPNTPLFACGFSRGAPLLCNYLASEEQKNSELQQLQQLQQAQLSRRPLLHAAACLSACPMLAALKTSSSTSSAPARTAVPLACFGSEDDWLVDMQQAGALQQAGAHSSLLHHRPNLLLALTRRGGHTAWCQDLSASSPSWSHRAVLEFFNAVLSRRILTDAIL